jgi:hypothetical protein
MAPEIILGRAASARSDVYGLAASAFAMMTLVSPWGDGEAVEIVSRQCNDPPPRLSALRAELAALDGVLAAALDRDVERRPDSAGTLARSLASALGTILPASTPRARHKRARPSIGPTAARTRGVVFRSVARALGVRDADRLRDAIGSEHAELAHAIGQCAPLAWAPSKLLVKLIEVAPKHVARDGAQLARDIARATVRTSFRSFFPASSATLHPDRTLSAIRSIWARYHTWGDVSAIPVRGGETVVRITETLRERALCAWTCEMLATLAVLSGGIGVEVKHEHCEADDADACVFRVTWTERTS